MPRKLKVVDISTENNQETLDNDETTETPNEEKLIENEPAETVNETIQETIQEEEVKEETEVKDNGSSSRRPIGSHEVASIPVLQRCASQVKLTPPNTPNTKTKTSHLIQCLR